MGEIVMAAVVAHQPMMMLPADARVALGGTDADCSLVEPGFARLQALLQERHVDTFVIVDTHWFTTTEHVVAGADRFAGLYTSEELPGLIADLEYGYPGAPDLARAAAERGATEGVPVLNATMASLPLHYPTLNLVHHLRTTESVLSVSVLQTAQRHNYLDFGRVLGDAVRASDRRVAILGSGGMSHTFWPADVILDHLGYDPSHVISDEARRWDRRLLDWWAQGDHAAVIDAYDEYLAVKPEGRFAHYLVMAGALGASSWRTPGVALSEYENAVGTAQIHVAFAPGLAEAGA